MHYQPCSWDLVESFFEFLTGAVQVMDVPFIRPIDSFLPTRSQVAAALEVVVAKAREDSGGSSSSDGAVHIVWRGKQVSLRTALLRDAVLKAQHLSTEVATATAAAATAANDSAAKDTAEPSGKGGNKHNSIAPGPSKALLGKCVSAFDDLLTLLQQLVSELESKGQVINGGGVAVGAV